MAVLVTGAAGFIGYYCARALLRRGETVVGVDNFNPYYSLELKRARLIELQKTDRFRFHQLDISDVSSLEAALAGDSFPKVVHLAAQPGVGYSIRNPQAYIRANLVGHANVLEFCRRRGDVEHLVYASSSSVYGGSAKVPFGESDPVDRPISLYAATKRADELMSFTYAHLFGIRQTGLRFFTVYGPWGRPDMAVWIFAESIFEGRTIALFNMGNQRRDFTYIDDVIERVLAVLDGPPSGEGNVPHRIYNVGCSQPRELEHLVKVLEDAIGLKARTILAPMQPGDMAETAADVTAFNADFGVLGETPIEVGVPRFVDWYRSHRGLNFGAASEGVVPMATG